MRKIDGNNGPVWIRETTVKTTISGPTVKRYTKLLNRPVKIGETIEVDVSQLLPQSNVEVAVTCPMCLKEYNSPLCTISTKGHSFCQPCKHSINAYGNLIGKKIGRMIITGFGQPTTPSNGRDRTTLTATCDCGNQATVYAQSVRRSLRKGTEFSCGCYALEHIKQVGFDNAGSNNGMYRHDLSLEQRVAHKKLIRHIKKTWGKAIRRRDSVCAICDCSDNLEAHHLFSTVSKPEFCLSPENGIALCTTHHQDFHCVYMGHVHAPTTPNDFYSYLQSIHDWTDEQIEKLISNKQLARGDHALTTIM